MKKIKYLFPFMLIFIVLLITSAHAADSITVSCYVDNPSDNIEMGDIEVFNIDEAANACNNTFDDCEGNCTGCYINSESIEICVDMTGNKFNKE
ncbi:MAG: hypothetical protein A2Y97_00740 [Nitrospirae bacterium RBG_13_39_12]|nr:MAG: hypothetical protein A2Y97_00740 [Nitrospirae bacterium RBG_13_39_12]